MNRTLVILFFVAAMAAGGGFWLSLGTQPSAPSVSNLFEGGAVEAEKVTQITLQNSQQILLQASLIDGTWIAALNETQGNYPLSKAKLAEFLSTLVQARLIEAKTSKQENYHHLGVESIDSIDSLATQVSLKIKDKNDDWQVLIGSKASMGEGTYVRLPHSQQSWLVDKEIELPSDEFEWLQHQLLPFKAEEIESITRLDDKNWNIIKVRDDGFQLNALPRGRELRYPSVLSAYVDNIIELDFEQILPLSSDLVKNAKSVLTLNLNTSEKQVVQINIAMLDNVYYLKFSSPELNGYWLNWAYEINAFSAQQLIKTKDDFLAQPSDSQPVSPNIAPIDEGVSPN